MNLNFYPKIEVFNDVIAHKYKNNNSCQVLGWVVTELVDGDHLALYANYKNDFFKPASRNNFIQIKDGYSDTKACVEAHKTWIMELSKNLRSPVIVYGRMIGGHYKGISKGIKIKSVCEYSPANDFMIHDIRVQDGLISMRELDNLSIKYALSIAPVLYSGTFDTVIAHPANKLSAIPFTYDLPVKYDNEMKGIVIRPIFDMYINDKRVIFKKSNPLYSKKNGSRNELQIIKSTIAQEVLEDIAQHMENMGAQVHLLDSILILTGGFRYKDIDSLAGRYSKAIVTTINYMKYNLLTEDEKHKVNKAVNMIAKAKITKLYEKAKGAA